MNLTILVNNSLILNTCYVITASLICYSVYWYAYGRFQLFKKIGVPGPEPQLFFGNTNEIDQNYTGKLHVYIDENLRKFNGSFGFYYYGQPRFVSTDPDLLKEVLVKQFDKFQDRKHYDDRPYPLNLTLGAARGKQWKHIRSNLAPTFTTTKLKLLAKLCNNATSTTLGYIENKIQKSESLDVNKLFTGFSMETIILAIFGIKSETQTPLNKQISTYIKTFFSGPPTWHLMLRMLPLSQYVIKFIPNTFYKSMQNIITLIKPVITQRKYESSDNMDILQLMINSQDEKQDGLKSDELIASCFIFLAASVETTAATLSCLIYELTKHPHYQELLLKEIKENWKDTSILPTYDTVQNMAFMNCLIKESLRLYPPATLSFRAVLQDCEIKGVKFCRGTDFILPIYTLHRDPKIWERPDDFWPERFNSYQQKKETHYIPFGYGPRSCIGMRFAQTEMKILLTRLINTYKFVANDNTPTELHITMNTLLALPRHDIPISIKKR